MTRLRAGSTKKKRRKRKSKEFINLIIEGKKTRIHITPITETKTELQTFKKNPDLIKFGTIGIGGKTLKAYAFKNQPKLIFIRINNQFIPLNKHKLREMVALCTKAAWFIGLYGKRAKKYRDSLQA